MTLGPGQTVGNVFQNATSVWKKKGNWSETYFVLQITTMTPIKNAHYCLQREKRPQHILRKTQMSVQN